MKIALLVEEGSTLSSVAVTLDMVRLAQRFGPKGGLQVRLFSTTGGPVRLCGDVMVETRRLPTRLSNYDAVVLPGFFAQSTVHLEASLHSTWLPVIARLRKLPQRCLIAASCYGTFVLAEAGLLDGAPATTTWWLADVFAEHYPHVKLDADKTLIDAGHSVTAGAMTAHTDLMLHVLRRLGGSALARSIAGIMLVDGARVSQRPFMSLTQDFSEPFIQQAIGWMTNNLTQAVSLSDLAKASHTSYRTLHRRFVEVTGKAPLTYWQALRIERVKELLEDTSHSLETIIEQVGYEDVSSFRRLFQRLTGVSPAQYRRQFRHVVPARRHSGPSGVW